MLSMAALRCTLRGQIHQGSAMIRAYWSLIRGLVVLQGYRCCVVHDVQHVSDMRADTGRF